MPEKKSTSTNEIEIAAIGPGGSNLGRASYRAIQSRDAVIIFAFGVHPTPGYIDFFEQSPIDIFPPQFIFRSIPPGGMVPQVLSPFSIWVMFGATEPIKTVTVHDADGAHQIEVEQIPKSMAAAQERSTWVSGSVVRGGGAAFNPATTMATGEEGGGPTTMATGEEGGGGPTTMATGEEQASIATTLALGEEEPPMTTLALGEEDPTTKAIGEEGPTTLRVGEEGPTTMALGEEGQTGLTMTTLALGEEDPPMTTLALGEEDPTTKAIGEEGPTTLAVGEEGRGPFVPNSPFGSF